MSDRSETSLPELEVAIKLVDTFPGSARAMIDYYIEIHYEDGSGQPIIRRSRLEAKADGQGTVYRAVLKNPSITSRFLQDPSPLLDAFHIKAGKPYLLNTRGTPNINASCLNVPSQFSVPSIQPQIDRIIAQNQGAAFQVILSAVIADIAMLFSASNLLSNAMHKIFTLQASLTTTRQMILLAQDDPTRVFLQTQVDEITTQLNTAKDEQQHRAIELAAIQIGPTAPPPPQPTAIPAPINHPPTSSPGPGTAGPSRKRPHLSEAL